MKNNFLKNKKSGFTLIETLVAVLIFSLALTALLRLSYSNKFSAQYAGNEITAMYLAQEVIDYIRNDRDTTAFQGNTWANFLDHYGDRSMGDECFDISHGCTIDVSIPSVVDSTTECATNSICPILLIDSDSTKPYYTYTSTGTTDNSLFRRTVKLRLDSGTNGDDELIIEVRVEWRNGTVVKSQLLQASLLKWK